MNQPVGHSNSLHSSSGKGKKQGLRNGILKTVSAFANLLTARSELLATEAAEAARRLAFLVLALLAAIICATAGWLLFIIAFCFLLAGWFSVSPAIIGAGLGLLHIIFTAGLGIYVFRSRTPFFQETINEFRKDREWLSSLGKK